MHYHPSNMTKVLAGVLLVLQFFLIFLLCFETRVVIPSWLQPIGRMHPMWLHLPIGFYLALVAVQWLKGQLERMSYQTIMKAALDITVLVTTVSAIMGFILAREEGYGGDLVFWHKWTGLIFNFIVYLMWLIHHYSPLRWLYHILMYSNILLLLVAGHYGAAITHGEDFILQPVQEQQLVTLDTPVYNALIRPIFQNKCFGCHNPRKEKGGLNMTTKEGLIHGGDNGPVFTGGDAANSSLLKVLDLPPDHDQHMPPEGKPQVKGTEYEAIKNWIQAGAHFEQTLDGYAAGPEYSYFQQAMSDLIAEPSYDFDFVDPVVLEQLNTPFRSVHPVSANSPAVSASIFVRATYEPKFLEELLEIKEQLISLSLTNLPIQDHELQVIANFSNLEKLILNGTDISSKGLRELAPCRKLNSLGVTSTHINIDIDSALYDMASLRQIYIWNTQLQPSDVDTLQIHHPKINFNGGFVGSQDDTLQLNPPFLRNKKLVIDATDSVRLQSLFDGVTIKYTLDGSVPDSNSTRYIDPLPMKGEMYLKAVAFRDGWKPSIVAEYMLYQTGHRADRAVLAAPSNNQFRGSGASGLIDYERGNNREIFSPYWIGYRDNPLEALIFFENKPQVSKLLVSYSLHVNASRMPPKKIEIWGGSNEDDLKQLAVSYPDLPKDREAVQLSFCEIDIPPSRFRCYKVIISPHDKLPAWHPRKGQKAFVMIDELLFY